MVHLLYPLLSFCVLWSVLGSPVVEASAINCFKQAQGHYELAYCEIKARGHGKRFPDFLNFQKNNTLTQYLLIKREAKRLRIPLASPRPGLNKATLPTQRIASENSQSIEADASLQNCQYRLSALHCGHQTFSLRGNRHNRAIKKGALSSDNRLGLGHFNGNISDNTQVAQYLNQSYTRYIESMLDIGLGGVTMSYTKFHYLFHDIHRKGHSFHDRFETMFSFLKKDKTSNAVNEAIDGLPGIGLDQCMQLNADIIVCDNIRLNRIYQRVRN